MDLTLLDKIKKLAVIAMVSDDELMEKLVFKGGNAIDLIYQISGRASIDLDFSIQQEFQKSELEDLIRKIERCLVDTFRQEGLAVFDIKFMEKPTKMSSEYKDFWGGYKIEFKVIPHTTYSDNADNIDSLRRQATVVGPRNIKTFKIEISKFEYCEGKIEKELDGYTLYVYTTEMLILEKIRSICQQVPKYREVIKTHTSTARARDFFDIYILMQHFPLDINSQIITEKLKLIFAAKKVPLSYVHEVNNQREFHKQDWDSVKDTVKGGMDLQEYYFYFDYVIDILESIQI